jgi:predicted HicB family RNase H-like nuclease
MKRIVNGVTYNTETSTKIAKKGPDSYQDDLGRNAETSATLYQTQKGACFIDYEHVTQMPETARSDAYERVEHEFVPMTTEEAKAWLVKENVEIIDDAFADGVPEAEAETESGATVYVRVPAALKRRIDEAAANAGQSASTWGLKCFERCLTHTR